MSFIHAASRDTCDYRGVKAIFEYTNTDGARVRTNCGQAAAATLLTFHGKLAPAPARVMARLERDFPPDNLGGLFGTSRRCVIRMCRAFGLRLIPVDGEDALRRQLAQGNPVAVMLGVSGGRFLHFDLPAGHWMTAYGYDCERIYLTNGSPMSWAEFRGGWDSYVPRFINMRRRGLAASSPRT
jgi:hypothetical protein